MDSVATQLNGTKNIGFGKFILKNKKRDDDDSDDMYGSDSSDYDSIKTKSTNTMKCNNYNGRLPTRRPDPNVFNRNAIMARENRRKKKEYIEMLEQDVEKNQKINKKLHKLLKRQQNYIETLKNERNYFKSILTNKTQILSLVNLVRTATVSPKSDYQFKISKIESLSSLSPNSSPQQLEPTSYSPNSSPQQLESSSYSTANSNDYNNDYSLSLSECNNSWDDLLQEINMDSFNTTQFDCDSHEDKSSIIQDEHSYFKPDEENANDSGVCLHISNGKLSLEFCAECHENSKKPFIEEF